MKTYAALSLLLTAATLTTAPDADAQEAYIGEIRQFPYQFCPRGWTEAEGQLLPINSNQALFSLLGTEYGGDGRTVFALPDLRTPEPPPPPPPPTVDPQPSQVEVYQHCGYEGWMVALKPGDYNLEDLPEGFVDDDASAVRIPEGWEVTIYPARNLRGRNEVLTESNVCLAEIRMNDRVSSLSVTAPETPPPAPPAPPPPPPPPVASGPEVKTCIALQGVFPSRN
ncbi:MAG: tail fiber protein [Pseudomonadota bacterium]